MRKRLKKHWKKILVVLGVAGIAAAIYFFVLNPQKAPAETHTVKRGTLREELTISGEVDAEEKVALEFQTGGLLSWVGVKEGDYVEKYQGVASLDQRELQKLLKKRLNDYLINRQNFDQTKDDAKDQVITDALKRTLVKSQASLDNTVLDVEIQDLAKQFGNLWTPISGIVTRVDSPHAGVNITPASTIIVTNLQTLYFEASADQTEVVALKPGQAAKLVLDSFPDKTFPGVIETISFVPEQTESGAVYKIKFLFPGNNLLRLGMTGDLTFITSERQKVLYVPTQYIKSEDSKSYVTVLKVGKKEKFFVTTGLETDENTEIKSGLKVGDKIANEK